MQPLQRCTHTSHVHVTPPPQNMPVKDFLTSINVLAAKVPPIEEHQLDLVTFVEGDEKDEQQQDGSQPSCQLHCVHELCWGQHTQARQYLKLRRQGRLECHLKQCPM